MPAPDTRVPAVASKRQEVPTSKPRIRIYSRQDCRDSKAAKEFLSQRNIAYHEVDIEENPEAAAFVRSVNDGKWRTPTAEVDRRVFHGSPFSPGKFAHDLGLEENSGR
jgi:mycoredoxin